MASNRMHDINGPCQCPKCLGYLPIRLAKGGLCPNQYYIHCAACGYHYTFMPGLAPQNATLPLPSLQPLNLPSAPAKNTEQCASLKCSRVRNRFCTLKMCKKCCTSRPTACSVTSHSTAKLRPTPVFTLPNLPSDVTPLPIGQGWDALNILIDQNPTVKLFHADEEKKKAEARERQREEEHEREDDIALAAAIAASLASPTPPSLKPLDSAGLLPLPLTPSQLPALALAPSVAPPLLAQATSLKLPTITNHLDSNWRRAHNDRSKEAQARKGKAQGDLAVIQKFFIMFWEQPGVPPSVLSVQVGSTWPKWTLEDCPSTQEKLGTGPLDLYDMRHRHWIQVDYCYPHVLSTDMYILLRRRGITCTDFDNSLARLLVKPTHLRFNMINERRSLRPSLKRQSDLDDSDFIDLTVTPKRHRPSEGISVSLPVTVMDSPSPSQAFSVPLMTDSPSPFVLSPSLSHTFVDSPSCPSASSSDLRPGNDFQLPDPNSRNKGKNWLAAMYVTDMHKGFLAMDYRELKGLPVAKRLEKVFGWTVPPRTFYDQRERWLSATNKEREDALAAGCSREGLWSVFASNIPLKKGTPSR